MPPMSPSTFEKALIFYARRFPIRRGKLRLIDSLWRVAAGNHGTRRVAELKYGDLKMPCELDEILQRQFYFFGTYFVEEQILDCWQKMANGAQVIFDVGANAGIFSLAALATNRNVTVHAFEPTPEIANRLREITTLNKLDQLHIHEVAISSENGHAWLNRFRGELGTNEGMNFITTDGESGPEQIPTVSLDHFCETHAIDHIDILKMDIQGHEHQALAGAEHLLNSGRIGIIFTELNWAQHVEDTCPASESICILEQAGYRFSKPGSRLSWKKSGDWMRTLSDVIARRASSK